LEQKSCGERLIPRFLFVSGYGDNFSPSFAHPKAEIAWGGN